MTIRLFAAAILPIAVAACAQPEAPRPAPRPAPPPPRPAPPLPVAAGQDWRDWALTPGDWTYLRPEAGHSYAHFGRPDGWTVELACDAHARMMTLSIASAPGVQSMTIRTSSVARTLPIAVFARADGNPFMVDRAQLAVADPLLDAMGFSRGRFVIERTGQPPLVIPAWPEILRVVENCRS